MNQQQVKYTVARVEATEARKLSQLQKDCTVLAKKLTDEEIVGLVIAGLVKPKKGPVKRDHHFGLQVTDVFDFSELITFQHMSSDYQPKADAIKAEAARIKDEIMLGDQQAALELLRKFDA